MRILLTNDDGVNAPGLNVLYEALKQDHEIFVVAPEHEMSGTSHGITVYQPLMVKKIKEGWFSVDGKPADCVKLAVLELIKKPLDVIISGINPGINVGMNVHYSGTVAAAMEGIFMGIPSVAISIDPAEKPDFLFAGNFMLKFLRCFKKEARKPNIVLNINIPGIKPDKISGVKITRQSTVRLDECYEKIKDPRGRIYYWLGGYGFIGNNDEESDVEAIKNNTISITPLSYDMTEKEPIISELALLLDDIKQYSDALKNP